MAEIFEITGKNPIPFAVVGGTYVLSERGKPPEGLSEPLIRQETMGKLSQVPLEIRPHVLMRGLSVITFEITITGTTDADMEAKRHDLTETLEDTTLYFSTQGGRGTRAELLLKADGAAATSYKSIFYGTCEEQAGRDVLGALIKEHRLYAVKVTLYCEPHWRPVSSVELGPNQIKTPSLERDGNADGLADNWVLTPGGGHPVVAMESTIVLNGCKSQKVTSDAAPEGIYQSGIVAPAGTTKAVAYAWICRPAAGSDIEVYIWDITAGVPRDQRFFSTGGWQTKVVGANTWYRVVVSSSAIVAGNSHYLIIQGTAATPTVFYVDMTFWKWGTIVCPDEWIDHYLIYNHEDADVDHINHMDLADLKGDVKARTLVRAEYDQHYDDLYLGYRLFVGRRTEPTPCAFLHWLEGENATSRSNWVTIAGAPAITESNGARVTDAANALGWINFDLLTLYGASNIPYAEGWFDLFVRVFTNDIVNTQYRAMYTTSGGEYYNAWKKQSNASLWQLLYLGQIYLEAPSRFGINRFRGYEIQIEYSKDAADTVSLDFLWLIPRREPETRLSPPEKGILNLSEGEWWAFGQSEDFDYLGIEVNVPPIASRGVLEPHGVLMTLAPAKDNRLYFGITEKNAAGVEVYMVHDTSPAGTTKDVRMIVSISYSPQFISPME